MWLLTKDRVTDRRCNADHHRSPHDAAARSRHGDHGAKVCVQQ